MSQPTTQTFSSAAFADTKPHYELLDGLRGVAALLVLWYHVHEGFSFAQGAPVVEGINHGYLAVDFFFMLSGFVIGYAYDDRWGKTLTTGNFFKRRLIRLHPMVVMGALLGTASFLLQGSVQWDGTRVATSAVTLALLCTLFFIPALPGGGCEIRGNGEAFPVNGPAWSLFFEYIGNILYALFIRRLSTKALTVLVVLFGAGLAAFAWLDASGYGNIGVGWTLADGGFWCGLLRMLFPFSAGMLLSRRFKPVRIRGVFWICSAALLCLFLVPNIESEGGLCLNGVYESFCVIVMFPLLVWLGASGSTTDPFSSRVCKFLGDISFPLYITHYPTMYLFYAWLMRRQAFTLEETWPVVAAVCVWNVLVAWACLRLYDIPVRKWLAAKFLSGKQSHETMRRKTLPPLLLAACACLLAACASCASPSDKGEKRQGSRDRTVDVRDRVREIDFGDVLIGSGAKPRVFGKYLVVTDYKSHDTIVHVFDKNTFRHVCSLGEQGPGPKEITIPGAVAWNGDKHEIYVTDNAQHKILSYNLDSVARDPRYVPGLKANVSETCLPNDYSYVSDTLCYASFIMPASASGFNQTTGKWNMLTGDAALTDHVNPPADKKKRVAFAVSPERGLLVECNRRYDVMTLYDLGGKVLCDVYGPKWDENGDYGEHFKGAEFCGDKIIASYVGQDWRKNDGARKFHVFSLSGDYLKTLDVGRAINRFCCDEENGRIIMEMNSDMQFGYLDLKGLF